MIYIAADHRGFFLKEELKKWMEQKNIPFVDCGNDVFDQEDDYVDFAKKVAENVSQSRDAISCVSTTCTDLGIVICGSGVGVCVTANKFKNIRCGTVFNKELAVHARANDDVNVASLPSDYLTSREAIEIVEIFINTPFSGKEKYIRRINKIKEIEK